MISVEFDFAPSGCPIFPALYTIASLGATAASLDAMTPPPPHSMPHHHRRLPRCCHHFPDVTPSPLPPSTLLPTSASTPPLSPTLTSSKMLCHHCLLPRHCVVTVGPALLRRVPLLLRLVLWTFPSAPISALVSLSTICRFRLRRER
jgi:hypothetical protein